MSKISLEIQGLRLISNFQTTNNLNEDIYTNIDYNNPKNRHSLFHNFSDNFPALSASQNEDYFKDYVNKNFPNTSRELEEIDKANRKLLAIDDDLVDQNDDQAISVENNFQSTENNNSEELLIRNNENNNLSNLISESFKIDSQNNHQENLVNDHDLKRQILVKSSEITKPETSFAPQKGNFLNSLLRKKTINFIK